MRRQFTSIGALALLGVLMMPAVGRAQQAVNLYVGGFVPRPAAERDHDDVLRNDLDFLAFRLKDFHGVTAGAEWLIGLNEFVDAGLGAGIYSRTVPSVYADFVNTNGAEIEQDLQLRMVPLTATLRWLPLGRRDAFVPYVGAGVGVIRWRYSETGQFVDFNDNNSLFTDTFAGTGSASGPVILGGVRFPAGSVDVGGEVRYQRVKGDLPSSQDFAGSKIDLGGLSYLLTLTLKF
jgi:opacity protein-like surface antigen